MNNSDRPTLIIGAGLAGLTAARELTRVGHRVHVVDKGRGVGGRMATRRMGDARLDHGAQFFTVRGEDFRSTIDDAINAGVVGVWCHGFGEEDGYPRYYCPAGMTGLAKWLAEAVVASGGTIETSSRVSKISAGDSGVHLDLESEDSLSSDTLIVTSPVPQTLELFDSGNLTLAPEQRSALEALQFHRTIALLVHLDHAPNIAPPGGIQTPADTFSFIGDNFQKGVSAEQAVTFHLNNQLSLERWDEDSDALRADLIALAEPWIGTASILESQLHKWKYAGPVAPYPDRTMVIPQQHATVVLAGAAFGGPKVEGAFNSGLAAARELLS